MGMYGGEARPVVTCGPSRTKQGFRNVCNINAMVEKYRKTGLFSNVNRKQPVFADVSEIRSYQESLNVVVKAREAFEALDPKLRTRFDNDPAKMVAFLENGDNYDEAVKLGMVVKRADSPKSPDVGDGGASKAVGGSKPVEGASEAPKAS